MSNYLRNRPFMVISYTYVLAAGQKSNTPGFNLTAQWDPVENMVISDRVSTKQMQHAELIIDLFENKVIKCRDGSLDHEKLIQTFVTRHYQEIKGALATWIQKDPTNLGRVQSFIESFKAKAEANKEATNDEGNSN